MSDSRFVLGTGAFGPEPERDVRLASALRTVVGDVPSDVDWSSLASRISVAVTQRSAPWWGWAARWERRVVSVALAAGIAGAVALWNSAPASAAVVDAASSPELVTAVVEGAPAADAATSFARSLTVTYEPLTGVVE